ncbi:uncharacterized protein TNCV_1672951 [Trichonephila clavipes]|nr:uncharacterized protein TNCV_1672951 [Trichonephila clavipes]
MYQCKAKAGLRRSPGSPQTNTIVITAVIKSKFIAKDDLVPFQCSPVSSCAVPFQTETSIVYRPGQHRNWAPRSQISFARCLRMVREHTGAYIKGSTCVSIAADDAVVCTRAFLTMLRSSRRLLCRGRLESSLHLNDISRIHWSQHFLSTQTEWHSLLATRLANLPASDADYSPSLKLGQVLIFSSKMA